MFFAWYAFYPDGELVATADDARRPTALRRAGEEVRSPTETAAGGQRVGALDAYSNGRDARSRSRPDDATDDSRSPPTLAYLLVYMVASGSLAVRRGTQRRRPRIAIRYRSSSHEPGR